MNRAAICQSLIARDFSLILLERREKKPQGPWKQAQTRRSSWSDLEAQLAASPDANRGVVTGAISQVVVLDLDSESAVEEAKRLGLPVTLTVKTGKGVHAYFRHPGFPISNRTAFRPGMDIRGDGGYVVAPGSTHPSGAVYTIIAGDSAPLAAMPDWLRADLGIGGPIDDGDAEAVLQDELARVADAPAGTRNDQLNRSAFALGQLAAALDQARVWSLLQAAALKAGLTRDEARRTIRSGWEAGLANPRTDARRTRSYEELLEAAKGVDEADATAIGEIAAEAAHLDPVPREKVLKALKARSGIGIGSLRQQARNATRDEGLDHLQIARVVIEKTGKENLLCTTSGAWGWDDGGVWKLLDDRVLKQSIQGAAEARRIDVTAGLVNGVLDVMKSEVFVSSHLFNQGSPEAVNCLNGEVELVAKGWQLVPHRREHFRTTQIPVAYDPDAKAPAFLAFLDQIFRDDPDKPDKIRSLLELTGYTLMSHALCEKFVFQIGAGANGKSVFLFVLENLCGPENVSGVQPSQFDRAFQRAHLDQKLANIVTELKQGEIIADAELKAITSGERSTVERKHCPPFDMRPFATVWFGTNHMPRTRDFSEALFRRAVIITFNRIFLKEEQDRDLGAKLLVELPGILNLALEAYGMALLIGFTDPPSSEAAKGNWRLEADQVAQFVEDRCLRADTAETSTSVVFEEYNRWAGDEGISRTMGKKGLRERLTRLGFGERRDAANRYVVGLKLDGQNWGSGAATPEDFQ